MNRREVIALLGGAAAWPVAARAQQPAMPVVGYLSGATPGIPTDLAFRNGLREAGYVEGQNLAIEYRWADGQYDRLPALAAELVSRRVSVIFASGGAASPIAAKAATATIPIVFSFGGDPVKLGLVPTFNRPGGNVTGVSFLINALGAKRLDLLDKLVPTATVLGFLVDPTNPGAEPETRDMQQAADALGRKLIVGKASTEGEIDVAFASFLEQQVAALAVAADAFLSGRADQLAALAAGYRIPAIYSLREYAEAGGLMSYGASVLDAARQAGLLTSRILKGEKPADLPVQQATKIELVINLKTAKALGITVPPNLLATADEVIE
jgi:putative ABC transport system substrate-binding protein